MRMAVADGVEVDLEPSVSSAVTTSSGNRADHRSGESGPCRDTVRAPRRSAPPSRRPASPWRSSPAGADRGCVTTHSDRRRTARPAPAALRSHTARRHAGGERRPPRPVRVDLETVLSTLASWNTLRRSVEHLSSPVRKPLGPLGVRVVGRELSDNQAIAVACKPADSAGRSSARDSHSGRPGVGGGWRRRVPAIRQRLAVTQAEWRRDGLEPK